MQEGEGEADHQWRSLMSVNAAINRKAVDLGKLAVEMTTAAGSGHPSTALSLAHLITVLMYHQMRWDPKDPWNLTSDRLILSEGHAVPIIYAALADLGAAVGKSKGDARRMIQQGGVYINGRRLGAERGPLAPDDLLGGKYVLVRKGARSYGLVEVAAQ